MTDADKFQQALQTLVGSVRTLLEGGDDAWEMQASRESLQEAFDGYCEVVRELHGSGDE